MFPTVDADALSGGSMRIPPAFCGVYGLKPTHNRTCGMSSSMCVVGPMAATAADLTIAYRLMAQPNPDDPAQNLLAVSTPPPTSLTTPKYLGICREWLAVASPPVRAILDQTLAHLTSPAGGSYQPVDIQLPYLREGQIAHSATCLTEAACDARGRKPADPLSLLNAANRILVGAGAQTPALDYLKYGQLRQAIMAHLAFLFESYPGMLLLTPTTPIAGWPIQPGDDAHGCFDGNLSMRNMTFAWLANTSGCPAVSFPAGYVDAEQGEGLLPVGLMAMGEWGEEERLLAFAREREGFLNEVYPGGRRRPEEWADVIALAREEAGKGKGQGKGGEGEGEE